MTLITSAGSRLFGWTPPEESLGALRFPSNVSGSDTAAPYAVIKFANPQDDGLPVWGPANAGVTVIRRIKTYQQTGYYAQFWWCEDEGAFSNGADNRPYWGAHPYPTNQNNSGTDHIWEMAAEAGDFFDEAGSSTPGDGYAVTKDVWYTQAIRVTYSGGTKTIRFIPDMANASQYIERDFDSSYGSSLDAIDFAVIIGDSPWFAGYQHERASMDMESIKIIGAALNDTDLASEAADMSQLVTAAAQGAIWWGKYGFDTVDDLTCDFGTERSFTRVDASDLLEVVEVA